MVSSLLKLISAEDDVGALNAFDDAEQDLKDVIHARLNERCEFDENTDCWVFTGHWDKKGQGCMRVGKRVYPLPRLSAWLYIEGFRLESPQRAYRTCACLACFNPDHVRIADDQADCISQLRLLGRWGGGRRKLTQRIADTLRAGYHDLPPGRENQERFIVERATAHSVQPTAIRNIVLDLSWRNAA